MEMSLEDYQRFCEEAPVGLYISRQSDGLILYINPAGAHLLGFNTPEEVIGKKKKGDFYDEAVREKLIRQVKEKGRVTDFEIVLTQPDGTQRTVIATARNGNERILGSLTDITDRKELERQLKEASAMRLGEISEQAKARANTIETEISLQQQRLG